MKKESKDSYLLNQPKYETSSGRPQLLRIELNPDFTKIDFGYQTTFYYVKGGWVRIDAKIFIRIHSTDEVLLYKNLFFCNYLQFMFLITTLKSYKF